MHLVLYTAANHTQAAIKIGFLGPKIELAEFQAYDNSSQVLSVGAKRIIGNGIEIQFHAEDILLPIIISDIRISEDFLDTSSPVIHEFILYNIA